MEVANELGALNMAEEGARGAAFARGCVSRRMIAWSVALTLAAGLCVLALNSFVADGSVIRSDGVAYFMYARSIVLDGDTDLTAEYPEVLRKFAGLDRVTSSLVIYGHRVAETGKMVVPWPIGAGIVMAPFYAMGYAAEYALASLQARKPDEYGALPQYFFGLGSVLFGVLAFWMAFACCERIGNVRGAYLASLSALLAGPAVFYIFFSPTMAHAASLGLVGVLTWRCLTCWQEGTERVFALGFLVGMLVIVRYQNVLFGMMVLGLLARDARLRGLAVGLRESAIAALGAAIPLALQAAHYVAMNGWSLGYQTEGAEGLVLLNHARIDFGGSEFAAVLLSCNKGAFYWAPVMAVGFLGLLYAARRHAWAGVTLAIFIANVVLISLLRWGNAEALDMGISFGMRYLTECSIGVAMGFAALVSKARSKRAWHWMVALGTLLSAWNLLLVLAYVLTIPRRGCVTYPEMARGMVQAVMQMMAALGVS